MERDEVEVHKTQKGLGQYTTIMTSRLVNNAYLILPGSRHEVMPTGCVEDFRTNNYIVCLPCYVCLKLCFTH